jgi:hypothetical protein
VPSEFVQLTPDRSATIAVASGSGKRKVRIDIVGPAAEHLASMEQGVPTQTRMIMRIDKTTAGDGGGAPRVWEPLMSADQDQLEEVALDYQWDSRRWFVEREYELPRGYEYSAYLEEREGILIDASQTALRDDKPIASQRVIYADRICLKTEV